MSEILKVCEIYKCSEKIKGFCIVKDLVDEFPEFEYLIQGGSSSYLHALNEKNVEIELHDIDILIGCEDINAERIISFITKNYQNVKLKDEEESIFYVYIGNDIILNFFINEIKREELLEINKVKVFGLNVRPFDTVLKQEKEMLLNISEDLEFCTKHKEPEVEIKYFRDKVRRKQEFLNLFDI